MNIKEREALETLEKFVARTDVCFSKTWAAKEEGYCQLRDILEQHVASAIESSPEMELIWMLFRDREFDLLRRADIFCKSFKA